MADTTTTTLDVVLQTSPLTRDVGLRVNLAEATCCVRREMLEGRERLVVPVVALNPGVLNDELVPASEVAASVPWNDTYTVAEAAEKLGCSEPTLNGMIRAGIIRADDWGAGERHHYLIPLSEIRRLQR